MIKYIINSLEDRLNKIPEGANRSLLRPYLNELLLIKPITSEDRLSILSLLWELGDRYWHTYEMMPVEDKILLEDYIQGFWMADSVEAVETLGGIAGMLGSRQLIDVLRLSLSDKVDPITYESILKTVSEVEEMIEDPFKSLKSTKA